MEKMLLLAQNLKSAELSMEETTFLKTLLLEIMLWSKAGKQTQRVTLYSEKQQETLTPMLQQQVESVLLRSKKSSMKVILTPIIFTYQQFMSTELLREKNTRNELSLRPSMFLDKQ